MIDITQYAVIVLIVVLEIAFEYNILRKLQGENAKHHIASHIWLLIAFIICLTYLMLTGEVIPMILWFMAVIWHLNKEARSMRRDGHVTNLKGL